MENDQARASTTFAADVQLLAGIRDFARDAVARWGARVDEDLLLIIVGELAANAAVHQGGEARLDLVHRARELEVSVTDPDPAMPWVDHGEPGDVQGHRGLRMVEALAESWGVERVDAGKRVWAVLPAGEAGSGDAVARPQRYPAAS